MHVQRDVYILFFVLRGNIKKCLLKICIYVKIFIIFKCIWCILDNHIFCYQKSYFLLPLKGEWGSLQELLDIYSKVDDRK